MLPQNQALSNIQIRAAGLNIVVMKMSLLVVDIAMTGNGSEFDKTLLRVSF
jgi:hypothetical protein